MGDPWGIGGFGGVGGGLERASGGVNREKNQPKKLSKIGDIGEKIEFFY